MKKEDLIYEAALWRLNKHNEYKVSGTPHPDAEIYDRFIKYLESGEECSLTVSSESKDEFLANMKNNKHAVEFVEKQLKQK